MSVCPACGTEYGHRIRICPRDGTVLEGDTPDIGVIGQVLDGKYRLESQLGQGGMGTIFKASHLMLGKSVAVKLINPALITSADVVRRFQREARAASQLTHPNIAIAHDLGQADDGTLYIVMELVDGVTLRDVLRSSGPLDPARIVRLMLLAASALSHAHDAGVIHRDLKPQNIMVTKGKRGDESVKLVDFGIAKVFSDESTTQLTETGHVLGTPQYMSPEQVKGQTVDARSDVYSLGVILYEMLCGAVPFNNASTPAVLFSHVMETPTMPSARRGDLPLPPALEAVAMRCLAKDPADRFQSVDDFADALRVADLSVPQSVRSAPIAEPEAPTPAPVVGATTIRTPVSEQVSPFPIRSGPAFKSTAPPPPPAPAPAAAVPHEEPGAAEFVPLAVPAGLASRPGVRALIAFLGVAAVVAIGVWVFWAAEERAANRIGGSSFWCNPDLWAPGSGVLVVRGCYNGIGERWENLLSRDEGQTWAPFPELPTSFVSEFGGVPGGPLLAVAYKSEIYQLNESATAWDPLHFPENARDDVDAVRHVAGTPFVRSKEIRYALDADGWHARPMLTGGPSNAVTVGQTVWFLSSDAQLSTDLGKTLSFYGAGFPNLKHIGDSAIVADSNGLRIVAVVCEGEYCSSPKVYWRRLEPRAQAQSSTPPWTEIDFGSMSVGNIEGIPTARGLWALHYDGIYHSDDSGLTLKMVRPAENYGMYQDIVADPKDASSAYVLVNGAILKTHDTGSTWTCSEFVSGACEYHSKKH